MKILATSSGKTLDSAIDPRFGRAAFFLLVDTATGEVQVHDNVQNLQAPQGAGIQSAQTASRLGAEIVLTGHCGPKAFHILRTAGIKVVVGARGTVNEALESLRKGEIQPSERPDVEGHWS